MSNYMASIPVNRDEEMKSGELYPPHTFAIDQTRNSTPRINCIGKAHNLRDKELKAYDDTKAGVDSGVTKLPRIFVHNNNNNRNDEKSSGNVIFQARIPVINMEGVNQHPSSQAEIIEKLGDACGKWGFFW
ncbi:hypothetical protein ACH5RR_031469 [Cinchona calisaya]|uniref:Uncharacterized protein n=1 Tax=Cinchona calisaya TaxID=153742 RepID=A0ABD2YJR7_9GENT